MQISINQSINQTNNFIYPNIRQFSLQISHNCMISIWKQLLLASNNLMQVHFTHQLPLVTNFFLLGPSRIKTSLSIHAMVEWTSQQLVLLSCYRQKPPHWSIKQTATWCWHRQSGSCTGSLLIWDNISFQDLGFLNLNIVQSNNTFPFQCTCRPTMKIKYNISCGQSLIYGTKA